MLINLDEAKSQLAIDGVSQDAELLMYIEALTPAIERHVGPVINREVTETIDGRGPTICVTQVPVVSLASLTPIMAGGLSLAAGDLFVDRDSGVIRRINGGSFSGGPWTAVYTAGRGDVVPDTIKLAAVILLQHLWRTQYGASRGLSSIGGGDDFNVTEPVAGWGYAIPNRVLQLLEPYKVPPGVA